MAPKKTTSSKASTADASKRAKKNNPDQETPPSQEEDLKEKFYVLKLEKASLLAQISKVKKEIYEARNNQRTLEFNALQEPQQLSEKHPEFAANVEMWSKITGCILSHVAYTKEEGHRNWFLDDIVSLSIDWVDQGAVGEIPFQMNIKCATDEVTKQSFVVKFDITSSEISNDELQSWFSNNPGNIEQIFKIIKAYEGLNKERRIGLENCKEEFGDIISIAKMENGETVVELGTADSYYFQIKWRIAPSSREFVRVKNICKINCTEHGHSVMETGVDLNSIKKQLAISPIEVITLLAKGIANQNKTAEEGTRRGRKKQKEQNNNPST